MSQVSIHTLFDRLLQVSPFVRAVKIQEKQGGFFGEWINDDNIFTYVKDGAIDIILDSKKFTAERGDAFLMHPYLPHIVKTSPGQEGCTLYVIHFDLFSTPERRDWSVHFVGENGPRWEEDGDKNEKVFSEYQAGVVTLSLHDRNLIEDILIRIHEEYWLETKGHELACKGLMTHLLSLFLRNALTQREQKGKAFKAWNNLEAALNYIHAHYQDKKLTVDRLGRSAQLTPNYLSALFKNELGISVHRYLNEVRLQRAKELMLDPGKRFKEIADQVGFSSIHVFSKVFKRHLGVSASEYLAGLEKKEANPMSERQKLKGRQA